MKIISLILLISGVASLFWSCAQVPNSQFKVNEIEGDEVLVPEDCMPVVLRQRSSAQDVPEVVKFINDTATGIFSCEYFRGGKIKVFGRVIQVNKRPVYTGYGYALADRRSVIDELLSSTNLESYYGDLNKKIKIKVEKRAVHIKKIDKNIFLYLVTGKYFLSSARVITVLSPVEFRNNGRDYILFMWAQGGNLTIESVVDRFRRIMNDVIIPEVRQAQR